MASERPSAAALPGSEEPERVEAHTSEPASGEVCAAPSTWPKQAEPRERPASMRGVVGSSSALIDVFAIVDRVADTDCV